MKGLTFRGLLLTAVGVAMFSGSVWFLKPTVAQAPAVGQADWLRKTARERMRLLQGELIQEMSDRQALSGNDCSEEQQAVQVYQALADSAEEALAVAEQSLYECLGGGGSGPPPPAHFLR